MAKENESHGGRDGEKKSGGFHKEGLRPSFPHTAVYIQQESLGLGGVGQVSVGILLFDHLMHQLVSEVA